MLGWLLVDGRHSRFLLTSYEHPLVFLQTNGFPWLNLCLWACEFVCPATRLKYHQPLAHSLAEWIYHMDFALLLEESKKYWASGCETQNRWNKWMKWTIGIGNHVIFAKENYTTQTRDDVTSWARRQLLSQPDDFIICNFDLIQMSQENRRELTRLHNWFSFSTELSSGFSIWRYHGVNFGCPTWQPSFLLEIFMSSRSRPTKASCRQDWDLLKNRGSNVVL